ncbi:hypothetical protein [Flavobacterium sp.]|uniref:hypothetical protein n=1 Tax=Flavobacterium sp. TaxID=239 RepID=UPI0028BE17EA|nr:hypothetical protein [Flavobacterium sp.]
MKKALFLILLSISFFLFSCQSSDSEASNNSIVDTFKLLTITSEGEVYEIGNNSGETIKIGQIENNHNLIMLSTLSNVGDKIYSLEATLSQPNVLIVFNKSTGNTTNIQLNLPSSVTANMLEPIVTSLEYDGTKLIAIVSENMPNDERPNKIVSINLQNYEITDLEINFYQRSITSTELINNKLYLSTLTEGLVEIDLVQKTTTELLANSESINSTRLAKINNSKIALMKRGNTNIINGVRPFEYNLDNFSISDKSVGQVYAVGSNNGGSVFHNGEYLNIIFNTNSKLGILKINYQTNNSDFVELDYNLIGSNAIIVDLLFD